MSAATSVVGQELRDRRAPPAALLDVAPTPGPWRRAALASSVSSSSSERGSSRAPALMRAHDAARRQRPAKTLNSEPATASPSRRSPGRSAGRAGRAEARHRLVVGHARPRRRRDVEAGLVEHGGHDRLDHGDHVVLLDERHLEVELGELRLAVGAQVLVAEAAGDLVVALEAGDHQQLLEQLRRLRQRVERAPVDRERHEEVARALGRRACEDRRLDLEEVLLVEHAAHGLGEAIAQEQRDRAGARGAGRGRGGAAAVSSSTRPSSSIGNGGVSASARSSSSATSSSISPVGSSG